MRREEGQTCTFKKLVHGIDGAELRRDRRDDLNRPRGGARLGVGGKPGRRMAGRRGAGRVTWPWDVGEMATDDPRRHEL
ncbi:hypothetical protein GOP47_0018590 [Adiantum capillus-veneris]|uniref:Uncharacterized protein n=1 Tax=Adiantum capillus-veneris TaxID=13818 RepID=A0A9D4ZAV5_ADICA|nr:hypothetical protein GOP47_0018590 [Adiantum capillus-veneris]